jgi:hypothetical protein
MSFVVKAAIADPRARTFNLATQKTMYGGKAIAKGDEIFVFASETGGGQGLIARGIVTAAEPAPRKRGVARQTPRVSIAVTRTALAKRELGRDVLKAWRGVKDGSPQAELDFKFYRQSTNKICGISDEAATFLRQYF